jgi:hypothetical protein
MRDVEDSDNDLAWSTPLPAAPAAVIVTECACLGIDAGSSSNGASRPSSCSRTASNGVAPSPKRRDPLRTAECGADGVPTPAAPPRPRPTALPPPLRVADADDERRGATISGEAKSDVLAASESTESAVEGAGDAEDEDEEVALAPPADAAPTLSPIRPFLFTSGESKSCSSGRRGAMT